jgi:simple sugar transport system substrate-binding protein
MRRILIAATAVAFAIGASLVSASAEDKLKVGFVYLGPVGDFGWTYQHELARQALVKEFGDKIETTYLENVSEGPDAERSIEQLVRAGNKLIFTTSFGYMDPTLKVAKKYPDVHFEHATGFKRDKNMSIYNGRFYEGRYIQGVIAGKMSKAGVLGYIASFPIPEVIMGINATILGAQTSRSSGPIPGSTRARKRMPQRPCSTREPTSSCSTPTARPRCRSRPNAASWLSARIRK